MQYLLSVLLLSLIVLKSNAASVTCTFSERGWTLPHYTRGSKSNITSDSNEGYAKLFERKKRLCLCNMGVVNHVLR